MTHIDLISSLTVLLDDVFYKRTIQEMRQSYFFATKREQKWMLLSDYYFGDEKPNKIITFSAMPACPYLPELQNTIKVYAPKDIKNTRTINADFIKVLNLLPLIHIVFIFENDKYFIWDTLEEAEVMVREHIWKLHSYIAYWRDNEPARITRLEHITKNLHALEMLLDKGKKLRIISAMFLIALLGGYVSSVLAREADLSSLIWFSDRDSTNEIGKNLIRDLFQITAIDILKKNVDFSFTTANSNSNEWYEEITRIPDYITGAVAGLDFNGKIQPDQKAAQMLKLHFSSNTHRTFLFRFKTDAEQIKLHRLLLGNLNSVM
jgi:hypothetical protein